MKLTLKNGGSLIELIIIFALALLLLPTLLIGLTSSREGRAQQMRKNLAIAQLKGVAEVVKNIKDSTGWDSLPANGTYYPAISQNKWVLSPGTNTVNGLTTSVVLSDVQRDAAGHIVATGGTIDSSTRKIVSTVSWTTPTTSSVSVTTYVSRFRTNVTSLDTTTADFTVGSASGTTIADTLGSGVPGDGEITLGAGGHGNWCSPSSTGTTVNLPKNGVANAVWAVEGKVSAATGDNASGVSFANVLVGNQVPPTASIEGTFDGYKTNAVYIDQDYAYIATDTNSEEVVILDLHQLNQATGKYAKVAYFNVPGTDSATSLYVSGTVGYVTSGSYLYTFDLSSKIGARAQLGSRSLLSTGKKVIVMGSYAYVGLLNDSTQLQVIEVSNGGATMTVVGQAHLNGEDATDLVVNSTGTRAYVTTALSAAKKELFIIDTSVKTGDRPVVGSYESNGMNPKGIGLTPGNRAVFVGAGGEEYQVINIANEAAPVRCGGMDVPSGVNGISTILESDGDAYSYIITGDAASELKIIIGGPGGQYATSGDFVSDAVHIASSAAFNSFVASANQPVQTTMQLQIAVAQSVAGSCTNAAYTFVGPDSANPTTSYFVPTGTEIRGAIPFLSTGTYTNPGHCFKYKIHMTTSDVTSSPVLSDLTVNYSQ